MVQCSTDIQTIMGKVCTKFFSILNIWSSNYNLLEQMHFCCVLLFVTIENFFSYKQQRCTSHRQLGRISTEETSIPNIKAIDLKAISMGNMLNEV